MKITDEKINQLAHLSRLEFDEAAKAKIKVDLENILDFCEKLNEVDTEGVEPLIYMTGTENNTREDVANQAFTKEELLANAPKKDSDFFRVPKVIEQNKG
jgi:aspartyl-tRNA(Asn)/glutamyl-tRNA(Gln) amidotransferase subunit C